MSSYTLHKQIDTVSARLGVPRTVVETVIRSYAKYVRYMTLHTPSTTFLGLFQLRNSDPEPLTESVSELIPAGTDFTNQVRTYAFDARIVASTLGIPYHTVKSILDDYRSFIISGISNGLPQTFYYVGSIRPGGTGFNLRSSENFPSSVRVHASRWFKDEVAQRLAKNAR